MRQAAQYGLQLAGLRKPAQQQPGQTQPDIPGGRGRQYLHHGGRDLFGEEAFHEIQPPGAGGRLRQHQHPVQLMVRFPDPLQRGGGIDQRAQDLPKQAKGRRGPEPRLQRRYADALVRAKRGSAAR